MANACFRCRANIPSGGTFCRECQSAVSFGGETDAAPTGTSVWWRAIAATSVGVVLSMFVMALFGHLGSVVLFGGSGAMALCSVGFMFALWKDGKVIQERDDVEWTPSDTDLTLKLFASVWIITIPLVSAEHLYRRRKYVGLPR